MRDICHNFCPDLIGNFADSGHFHPVPAAKVSPGSAAQVFGDVWEWTASPYSQIAQGPDTGMTIKGGSYLCADNFCRRYRPPARQGQEASLPSNHIGFRIVMGKAP